MPHLQDSHHSPYSPSQLFALVADVARYPEFLPWCRAARIIEPGEQEFLAELVIAFKGITERYTSRVILQPPTAQIPGRIDVVMVKGPFEYLENHWQFHAAEGGTRIDFLVDFKFRSRLLESLMGGLFGKASQKMSGAFLERAEALYGSSTSSSPESRQRL